MKLPRWLNRWIALWLDPETCPICGRKFTGLDGSSQTRFITDSDDKPGWLWARLVCPRIACEIEARRRNLERYGWDGVLR